VLGLDSLILPDDLPDAIAEAGISPPVSGEAATMRFHDAVKQAKKDLILRAVEEARGNYKRGGAAPWTAPELSPSPYQESSVEGGAEETREALTS